MTRSETPTSRGASKPRLNSGMANRCNTITLPDGNLAESCGCGCRNKPDIIVPHALIRQAARENLSKGNAANLIPGRPGGRVTALTQATEAMIKHGLLEPGEVSWT